MADRSDRAPQANESDNATPSADHGREYVRPGWDDYFLGIAIAVSARGDCRRSRVAAVLVDENRRIIATGYNGVGQGQPGCLAGACPRGFLTYEEQPPDVDYERTGCISTHAEENALNYALELPGQDWVLGRLMWSTIYVTREPCQGCADLLRRYGVLRFVWPGGCVEHRGQARIKVMTARQTAKGSGFVAVLADDYRREYEAATQVIESTRRRLVAYDTVDMQGVAGAVAGAQYTIREAKRNYEILTGEELT